MVTKRGDEGGRADRWWLPGTTREACMNIFELATCVAMVATGCYVGGFLGSHFGPVGWGFGFLGGFSIPPIALYAMGRALERCWPTRPSCATEQCGSREYELVEITEDQRIVFRCERCGSLYIQDLPYFKRIMPDGSEKSYMCKDSLGEMETRRWRAGSGSAHARFLTRGGRAGYLDDAGSDSV